MGNRRQFVIQDHYLLEVDDVKPFNGGTITTTYSWDVYIANNEDEYRGRAIEHGKSLNIPWTILRKHNFDNEMIKMCEEAIAKL
ncbi:hypothetical protein [Bacillus cereus]|uniref:hypothetical protein n=1 Tax=Bacillus cereus TaxID=1396 RepID=UPI0019547356|nr:hypothetical protein [Bacillus cereus]